MVRQVPGPGRPSRGTRPREELGRAVVAVLARARRDAGLTRQELAARSGISQNTIAKIERVATTDPSFTVVVALADALDVQLDQLADQAREALRADKEIRGVVARHVAGDGPESST